MSHFCVSETFFSFPLGLFFQPFSHNLTDEANYGTLEACFSFEYVMLRRKKSSSWKLPLVGISLNQWK